MLAWGDPETWHVDPTWCNVRLTSTKEITPNSLLERFLFVRTREPTFHARGWPMLGLSTCFSRKCRFFSMLASSCTIVWDRGTQC